MTPSLRKKVLPTALAVMIICLASAGFALAKQWPRPTGPVADYAKIISPKYLAGINNVSRELRQKTGAALVVATVPSLEGNTIEEEAVKLFERWGIGQKGKDNGLLVLVAMKERRMRIEVGYGLEGVVTDAKAGLVRDNALLPYFKKGQFGKGLYAASAALAGLVAKDAGVQLTGVPKVNIGRSRSSGIGSLIGGLVMVLVVLGLLGRRGRRGGPGGLLTGLLLGSMMSGGSRQGGGGFDSFGGGFGGFGGGMSGGGGASGGW